MLSSGRRRERTYADMNRAMYDPFTPLRIAGAAYGAYDAYRRYRPRGSDDMRYIELGRENRLARRGLFKVPKNLSLIKRDMSNGGSMYTAFRKRKAAARRPRKPLTFGKRVRKIVKSDTFGDPWVETRITADEFTSPVNDVNWITDQGLAGYLAVKQLVTTDSIVQFWRKPDVTTQFTTPSLVNDAQALFALMKYKVSAHYFNEFRNNTNFPALLTVYVFKCTQDTLRTPTGDLDDAYAAMNAGANANPGTVSFGKDPFQHWHVNGIATKDRDWKIHSKQEFDFQGGQEIKFVVKHPPFIFNPAIHAEEVTANATYLKGQFITVYRLRGHVAHSAGAPGNVGISNTQLDYIQKRQFFVSMKQNSMEVSKRQMVERSGFEVVNPVVADPQDVGVDVFENI